VGENGGGAPGDTHDDPARRESVRLREIADVHDGIAEVAHHRETQWPLATTFGVFKAKGASDVSVGSGGHRLGKIKPKIPPVHMTSVFTTVDHTLRTYHSAMSALVEGSVLAVVVVWFFLRNVRATVISALAIPLSAIPTFVFMQWMGLTLNQITLSGCPWSPMCSWTMPSSK